MANGLGNNRISRFLWRDIGGFGNPAARNPAAQGTPESAAAFSAAKGGQTVGAGDSILRTPGALRSEAETRARPQLEALGFLEESRRRPTAEGVRGRRGGGIEGITLSEIERAIDDLSASFAGQKEDIIGQAVADLEREQKQRFGQAVEAQAGEQHEAEGGMGLGGFIARVIPTLMFMAAGRATGGMGGAGGQVGSLLGEAWGGGQGGGAIGSVIGGGMGTGGGGGGAGSRGLDLASSLFGGSSGDGGAASPSRTSGPSFGFTGGSNFTNRRAGGFGI